jgi:hypothetical protein
MNAAKYAHSPSRNGSGFSIGGSMAQRTTTQRPKPQPIITLDEIDEALWWTSHQRDRNAQWHRWLDALLDARLELTKETA